MQTQSSTEYLVHNWLEALFAWFQVIVLWHNPQVSLYALTGLLSSFLLLTYLAPRFYATIMIALFLYNLNTFWFRHVWPSIRVPPSKDREEEMRLDVDRWTYLHPQLMTLKEFVQCTKNLFNLCDGHIEKLLKLRREKPVAFCLLICSFLTLTAYIGHLISGLNLLLFATTLVVSFSGVYNHLLPVSCKEWMQVNIIQKKPTKSTQASEASESSGVGDLPDNQQGAVISKSASVKQTVSNAISIVEHLFKKNFKMQTSSIDVKLAQGDVEPSKIEASSTTFDSTPLIDSEKDDDDHEDFVLL